MAMKTFPMAQLIVEEVKMLWGWGGFGRLGTQKTVVARWKNESSGLKEYHQAS